MTPPITGVPLSSWTPTLPEDVIVDSGVLYIGPATFAAHTGGLKFDPTRTLRQVVFDGQRSPIKGLDRTVEMNAVITGTIIQLNPENFLIIEPGAHTPVPPVPGGPSGATQLMPKLGSLMFAAGDYLTNVRCIWQRGDYSYVQVRMPAALCTKWDITSVDKEEAKIAVTIEARLDMTVLGQLTGNPAWVIEYYAAATP